MLVGCAPVVTSHAESSVERRKVPPSAAKNLPGKALLAVTGVVVERRNASKQQAEGVDALPHDADSLLIAGAAERGVGVLDRLVRECRPRTHTTHAAVALERADGAGSRPHFSMNAAD
jgi:hypothetical protein